VAVDAAAGAEADSVAEALATVVAVVDLAEASAAVAVVDSVEALAEAATLVAEVREAVGED
jgi:hypothetical protein